MGDKMSDWERYHFEERIRDILKSVKYYDPKHHMNPPFLTAYQIAIEFNDRHPEVAKEKQLQVGGAGIGERTSLSQYIAGELSSRIKRGRIAGIEGSFLSNMHLKMLSFKNDDKLVVSSLTKTQYDLSQFRLLPKSLQ